MRIARPQSNQQRQQQCTAAQQEAAQLASAFEGVSRVSDLYALGSGLGTLLAGAGEGITFGADTPITITFGSAATFFGGAALVTSAAASALNSFASGNLNSLGSFDLSHLGGIYLLPTSFLRQPLGVWIYKSLSTVRCYRDGDGSR